MNGYMPSDGWRFQNCHGLHDDWSLDWDLFANLTYLRLKCDLLEKVVMLVESMTDFIY